MSDSVVYKIHRSDLHALYARYKSIERLGRLIAENLYLMVAKRLDSFLYSTPEDRYKELLNRNSQHGVYYLVAQTNPHPIRNFEGEAPIYVGTLNFGLKF